MPTRLGPPPHKLKVWCRDGADPLRFWTCGRPGREWVRSGGRLLESIDEATAHEWADGILRRVPGGPHVVVSLLGRKPDPYPPSEFRFYRFLPSCDDPDAGRAAFCEWLGDITRKSGFASTRP